MVQMGVSTISKEVTSKLGTMGERVPAGGKRQYTQPSNSHKEHLLQSRSEAALGFNFEWMGLKSTGLTAGNQSGWDDDELGFLRSPQKKTTPNAPNNLQKMAQQDKRSTY